MCRLRSAINAQKPGKGISARSARRRRNVPSSRAENGDEVEGGPKCYSCFTASIHTMYCRHTYHTFMYLSKGLTALPGLDKSNFGQNALIDIKYIA